MKSLEEVFEAIEAFKKDMEDLGVDVKVAVAGDPRKFERAPGVKIPVLAVLQLELKEDLEAEGGMSSHEVRCPKCNGIMEKRKFVDTWYSDGKPLDVFEDWCCPACRLRWRSEDAEPEEEG